MSFYSLYAFLSTYFSLNLLPIHSFLYFFLYALPLILSSWLHTSDFPQSGCSLRSISLFVLSIVPSDSLRSGHAMLFLLAPVRYFSFLRLIVLSRSQNSTAVCSLLPSFPSRFFPCLSFVLGHSVVPFAFGAVKPFRYDFRYFRGIYSENLVSLAHYCGRLPISNHIMRLYSMISYRYLFIRNERRRRTFDTLGKEQLMDVKEVASELVNYTRTFPSVFAILPEINANHGFDFAGLLAACHITNKDI